MSVYYPKISTNTKSKEIYSLYKRRLMLILDNVISNVDDNIEELDDLDNQMLLHSKPLIFTGPESFEVRVDKQFNELALYVTQKAGVEAKKLTVFEFYSALEYIEKSIKYETNIL